ncbi:sugar transferase [Desertivirga xinjiangensis]|uniref:sugar transferase n=1 Tax=Desertivirga xinjiangensis TaxID=539206 RepID=UPI0021092AA3
MYKLIFKRSLDVFVAILGLVVLSPVLIVITVLLYFTTSGKPFFLQLRPGINGRIFKIIKFRSMNEKKDKKGDLLPDSMRLTSIGAFIRRTSLDEVPQLINVLKGDMSLVGPRPLLPAYLPLYNKEQRRRHEVKPGITGWAQVNGRNAISWQKKFEYDVWYVDHLSFALDMRIVCFTIYKVFKRDGVSANGEATMQAFKGN